jgi:hypothetical protein
MMSAPVTRDLLSLAHRQMASEGNGIEVGVGNPDDVLRLAQAIARGNTRASSTPAITAREILNKSTISLSEA